MPGWKLWILTEFNPIMTNKTAYEVAVLCGSYTTTTIIDRTVCDSLEQAINIAKWECEWEETIKAEIRGVLVNEDGVVTFRGGLHSTYDGCL
jgi:hypothetical protein